METLRQMAGIKRPEDHQQRNMQGRRLVVRTVERAERREEKTGDAIGCRFRDGELQREDEETENGDELRGEDAPDMALQLGGVETEEEGQRVGEVDRPVWDDRPRQEGNALLPAEADCGYRALLRRRPIGEAIAEIEKPAAHREPEQRPSRVPGRSRRSLDGRRAGSGEAQGATLTARLTVKMPQGSMRCSILRKPAAVTS